jgi:endo-1,4-beta-xylanase
MWSSTITVSSGTGYAVGSPNSTTVAIADNDSSLPPLPTGERLKNLAGKTHMKNIGCLTDLDKPAPYLDYEKTVIAREFNIYGSDSGVRPHIETSRGVFDFTMGDRDFGFARDKGLTGLGHLLVSYNIYFNRANWILAGDYNGVILESILNSHIDRVVGRYKAGSPYGTVKYWVVLLEVLNDTGSAYRPYGTGKDDCIWSKIGLRTNGEPLYIEKSLVRVHQVDPTAKLFISDWGMEETNPKSDAMYKLCSDLLGRGIPLNGVAFQGHCFSLTRQPNWSSVAANLQRFADLGLELILSEVDVGPFPKSSSAADLASLAGFYKNMTQTFMNQPACTALITFHVSSRYAWDQDKGGDHQGLLFDWEYTANDAYFAIQSVLGQAVRK